MYSFCFFEMLYNHSVVQFSVKRGVYLCDETPLIVSCHVSCHVTSVFYFYTQQVCCLEAFNTFRKQY